MVLLLDVRILSSPLLSAVCGILGYPKGSAAELLDGALKLRCCTTPFSNRFPTWSLPPVGNGRVRSFGVAIDHSVGEGVVAWLKESV